MLPISEPVFWLIIIGVLLFIEILTLGLTTIWFVGGGICSFVLSLAEVDFTIQVILFFVVSLLLLFTIRPSAIKKFNNKREKTNIDSLIGMECKVIETIDNFNGTGLAIADGKEWMTRADEDQIIKEGEKAFIVKISGVKLIVTNKQ